jgi:outer membrane autotransporter protein
MIRSVVCGIVLGTIGAVYPAAAQDEALTPPCSGDPIKGYTCNPQGYVATGAVFTAGESIRQGSSIGLIEGLLEENGADEQGGGASADLGGGFSLFAVPFGIFAEQDTERQVGFDSDRFGFVSGIDYTTRYAVVGMTFDYSREDIDFDLEAGTSDIDEYGISLFGQIEPVTRWYIFGTARYGWTDYEIKRQAEPGNVAEGTTDGRKIGLRGGASHQMIISDVITLNASVMVDWQKTDIDGYEETGAIAVRPPPDEPDPENFFTQRPNLRYQDDNFDSLQSILSLSASRSFLMQKGFQLTPTIFGDYIHEFKNDSRTINAEFAGFATNLEPYQTNKPDRDYFVLGGSLNLLANTGWSGSIGVSTWLGHSYRSEQVITLGLRAAL